MDKWKSAATGAGTGAAGGAAIGSVIPGVGTAFGAAAGGLVGGMIGYFGADGDEGGGAGYNPNAANFQYGLGQYIDAQGVVHPTPEEKAAAFEQMRVEHEQGQAQIQQQIQEAAAKGDYGTVSALQMKLQQSQAQYLERVNAYDKTGGQDNYAAQRTRELVGKQQTLEGRAADAMGRNAPQMSLPTSPGFIASGGALGIQNADGMGREQQLAALGGLQGQTALLNQYAAREQGPSAAQAQLQAGADMAARQQYGMARSQPGGGGAALRNAAFNAAGITGNAANQSAMLRAQEDQAWRSQQLAALGAAQQGAGMSAGYAGQLRAGDVSGAQAVAGQRNYDANAQNVYNSQQQQLQYAVGQTNLQAQQQQQQQNDAAALGWTGASQAYDPMRQAQVQGQTQTGQAYEGAKAQAAGLGVQQQQVNNAQSNAETSMALGAVSSGLGYYAQLKAADGQQQGANTGTVRSDIRAKEDIRPVSLTSRGDFADLPDPEAHRRQQEAQALGAMGGFRAPDLRGAQGYQYQYRDPQKDGAGTYVGPMAQDLQHIPGVVEQGADGMKAINAPRLTLANTAALSEIQRRQDELERQQQLQALGGSGFVRPDVKPIDYAALGPSGYHY